MEARTPRTPEAGRKKYCSATENTTSSNEAKVGSGESNIGFENRVFKKKSLPRLMRFKCSQCEYCLKSRRSSCLPT